MTFSIGFCFLPGEKKEDYTWALRCFQELGIYPSLLVMDGDVALKNASEEVYPNAPTLLCIWHINQCVLANCKSIIGNKDWPEFNLAWHSLIQARSIEKYEQLLLEFNSKYLNPKTYQCISYLQKEWLREGQKERLVAVYTDQLPHFGIRVTSTVEGNHAYIKRYLGGKKTKGDLFSTWLNIEKANTNQIDVVLSRTSSQRDCIPLNIDQQLFRGCFGVVTWYALGLVQKHLQTISLPLKVCTGSFSRSMGLPCAHICDIKKDTGGLTPSDFHEHWYWERQSVLQPLLDPLQVRGQQVARNPQVHRRTGRILSTGEVQPEREPPMCSACRTKGHTMSSRNCPAKLQASIAAQNQRLLDLEIMEQRQSSIPTTTGSIMASIPASIPSSFPPLTPPLIPESIPINLSPISPVIAPFRRPGSLPPLGSQVSRVSVDLSTRRSTSPLLSLPDPPSPKELSPDRPELLMKAYLTEKEAWLVKHPTVRPTEYRKARKWKTLRPKELKDQLRHMPRERRDLTGKIIATKPNWTTEEIMVWVDNESRKDEEEYERMEQEFKSNGNRHAQRTQKQMWDRVAEEHARHAERYIL